MITSNLPTTVCPNANFKSLFEQQFRKLYLFEAFSCFCDVVVFFVEGCDFGQVVNIVQRLLLLLRDGIVDLCNQGLNVLMKTLGFLVQKLLVDRR